MDVSPPLRAEFAPSVAAHGNPVANPGRLGAPARWQTGHVVAGAPRAEEPTNSRPPGTGSTAISGLRARPAPSRSHGRSGRAEPAYSRARRRHLGVEASTRPRFAPRDNRSARYGREPATSGAIWSRRRGPRQPGREPWTFRCADPAADRPGRRQSRRPPKSRLPAGSAAPTRQTPPPQAASGTPGKRRPGQESSGQEAAPSRSAGFRKPAGRPETPTATRSQAPGPPLPPGLPAWRRAAAQT